MILKTKLPILKNIAYKSFTTDLLKFKEVGGVGFILITCGGIYYEKHQIQIFLNKLIDSNLPGNQVNRSDYIYIKYHIYREFMNKLRKKEEEQKWINIIIHPIGKWWKSFKHSIAYRLLNVAQIGDKYERLKAVEQLASIDHLKDWDFQHLAQKCDARTAISLARSNCDNRWFLPLPFCDIKKDPRVILIELHKILGNIKTKPCWDSFLQKHFDLKHIKEKDVNRIYSEKRLTFIEGIDLLKEFVHLIYHLTKNVNICNEIIKQGGLTTLQELFKIFKYDNETMFTLCKIIANMSLCENHIEDFFVTGWVGILTRLKNNSDVRLQLISIKALTNLDLDDPHNFKYPPNIFPLYPRYRSSVKPMLDVVLIHGLLGRVFITWRQKDLESNRLDLYGKNAFYTTENDDVFLVGETKRTISQVERHGKNYIKDKSGTKESLMHVENNRKKENKSKSISHPATKELVETLENASELNNEWEVVFYDCPLNASVESEGKFSIAGNKWINVEKNDEYTNCWPMDWLPDDYPNIRVIGIDYNSALSEWSTNYRKNCPCEKELGHIENKSKYLLDRLITSNVGENRPIVWIGHSMGGILCKCILTKAVKSNNLGARHIAGNTKGIMFLGTPHFGSHIASLKHHMQVILSPSIEVRELELGSPFLIQLHQNFLNYLNKHLNDIKIVSLAEGRPTMITTFKFPLQIVTVESAKIEKGDFYILKDDHLSLSKPLFRQSFFYQRLLQLIDDILYL